ncbi:MAG: TetR family transcriptional regulator [Pseudomonadota bacterium]
MAAGLQLIDREGIDGLKMRALALKLGCDPMAIYHFVPNKAALLEAITELLERQASPPAGATADWQTALQEYAANQLAVALRHPKAIPLFTLRVSDNAATQAAHAWLRELFEALRLPDTAATVRLCTAGINGVLLNYSVLQGATGNAERIAKKMMREMVEAICLHCTANRV